MDDEDKLGDIGDEVDVAVDKSEIDVDEVDSRGESEPAVEVVANADVVVVVEPGDCEVLVRVDVAITFDAIVVDAPVVTTGVVVVDVLGVVVVVVGDDGVVTDVVVATVDAVIDVHDGPGLHFAPSQTPPHLMPISSVHAMLVMTALDSGHVVLLPSQ